MENSEILNEARNPVVQGRFYPGSEDAINAAIEAMIVKNRYAVKDLSDSRIIGAVLPHAGYIYSGWQTVPLFLSLTGSGYKPETVIIIHPNHTGYGGLYPIDPHCCWKNCMGKVELDHELGMATGLPYDERAHIHEHSAEVIIPYLQFFFGSSTFRILPVCMLDQSYNGVRYVTEKLIKGIKEVNRKYLVIASSDFSHYEPPKYGYNQDQFILNAIETREPAQIINAVREHSVSVCGSGPIAVLTGLANSLYNVYETEIIARGHSGEVSPSESVVDYISILYHVKKEKEK